MANPSQIDQLSLSYFMQITQVDEDFIYLTITADSVATNSHKRKIFVKELNSNITRKCVFSNDNVIEMHRIDSDLQKSYHFILCEDKKTREPIPGTNQIQINVLNEESKFPPRNNSYKPQSVQENTVLKVPNERSNQIHIFWCAPSHIFGSISYIIINDHGEEKQILSLPYSVHSHVLPIAFKIQTVVKVENNVYKSLPSATITVSEEDNVTIPSNIASILFPADIFMKFGNLESIDAISYVLTYNAKSLIPPRLPYSCSDFWNKYVNEEHPTYSALADEIEHDKGSIYEYTMQHPLQNRLMPILKRIVDQLKYPSLDSDRNNHNEKMYSDDILKFFVEQTPEYEPTKYLVRTCLLFCKNTTETAISALQLFVTVVDIYDRIIFYNINGIQHPKQIIPQHGHCIDNFAENLNRNDCFTLNKTMFNFKNNRKSIFRRLHAIPQKQDQINDNVRNFQMITLSFILFIKSFICDTGNNLEKHHVNYESNFEPNIKSLIENKRYKQKHEEKYVNVDDSDVSFHNENMPLQFDLCILPKHAKNDKYDDYALETNDDFHIVSTSFTIPTDRSSIYKLYGQLVKSFRKLIFKNRKNDRYCIVIDQKSNKLFIYAPSIYNGTVLITRRGNKNHGDKNKVRNKFSLMAVECNDITNFYLTSKCLIPSKRIDKYYGIEEVNFVLSAHFHQQQSYGHPKLKLYQYFNGCGLRFLHKYAENNKYKYCKDMTNLWPKYFVDGDNGIDDDFILNCDIFDAVMDIYKCDPQYVQWDNVIKKASADANWKYQKDIDFTELNADLIIIPDEVITIPEYLESIKGITYVLSYNNAITPPRLSYECVKFWNEYAKTKNPTYQQIVQAVVSKQGPTADYLLEKAPNDGFLSILQKVVEQLKHPMLYTDKQQNNTNRYKKEVVKVFQEQTPDYRCKKHLSKTCVLFKFNTNGNDFDAFELFVNVLDIYDRILYDNKYRIIQTHRITNTKHKIKHHFADKLTKDDCVCLNKSIATFKEEKCSFFKRLKLNIKRKDKIDGDIQSYQLISLSFLLFIKSFICKTGNGLEKKGHGCKQLTAATPFESNIQCLIDIKKQRDKIEEKTNDVKVEIDDNDIFYDNDNMPLQFDLCILPNAAHFGYGLEEKRKDFVISSAKYVTPTDRESVHKLYGDLVSVFRETLMNNNKPRHDRYCIVFNQNTNKFYIYPPNIHVDNDNSQIHKTFSLLDTKYNDITNLYFTSKCLIPSKYQLDKYYGIDEVNFVLSAHYHQQRKSYRYPKLRIYQYFNGCGLRFLHKYQEMENYTYATDITDLWPKYFVNGDNGIGDDFIIECDIFDAVMDIYKCDAQYFQWDNAIKKQLTTFDVSEESEDDDNILKTCEALGRYYASNNKPYDRLFSTYCDENDIDDNTLAEELEKGFESRIVHFDEEFPVVGNKYDRAEDIFAVIEQCYLDTNITFSMAPLKFEYGFFDMSQKQYDEISRMYEDQCPSIFNDGMKKDAALLMMLAIGKKNQMDYLLHLVDDYFCHKIRNIRIGNASFNVAKWINSNAHFYELNQINHKVLNESTPYALATQAVNFFVKRLCRELHMKQRHLINDSVEAAIRYIESVTIFISDLFKECNKKTTVCPFQIDLCLAPGEPLDLKHSINESKFNDDTDDDSDEDDDYFDQFVDCIGNIEAKLIHNHLLYKKNELLIETNFQQKIFTILFNQLYSEYIVDYDKTKDNECHVLYQKRIIGFVDRRKSSDQHDSTDTVYLYQPPTNCFQIPTNACGLWYLSASRMCLLPNMDYGNGAKELEPNSLLIETLNTLKNANVTSAFHCKGGLLTISFHVKSKDEVKMYMYFDGQMIRIMPKDIPTIFPILFNMEYGNNEKFMQNKKEMDSIVQNISKVIKDVYFQAFQSCC
eukprot:459746_1